MELGFNMSRSGWSVVEKISHIGADPDDDDDIRLKKSLLSLCALPLVSPDLYGD